MSEPTYESNHQYLDYLAKLGEEKIETLATEDIFNEFGVLLVPKGQKITLQIANQLKQHPLTKPFDLQIELSNCKTNHNILNDLIAELNRHPALLSIYDYYKSEKPTAAYLTTKEFPLSIRQKLTVMAEVIPHVYREALILAWFSGLVARKLNLDFTECSDLVFATLVHDIGFVFLPAELSMQQVLDDNEVAAMKSHVVVGKMILELEQSIPKMVIEGVTEHHERLDRTGYPTRKSSSQIGLFGQVIGCVNLAYDIYTKDIIQNGLPFNFVGLSLKMHSGAFNEKVINTIRRLLNEVNHLFKQDFDSDALKNLKASILHINNYLTQLRVIKESLKPAMVELHKDKKQLGLITNYIKLEEVLKHSGIDHSEFVQGLPEVELDSAEELLELYALHNEVIWIYKRIGWHIQSLLEAPNNFNKAQVELFTVSAADIGKFVNLATQEIIDI